ncbi:MAG: family 65 glycosyl hydrolase domain-containing protein [Bacteroidota bacterium]
MKDYIKLDEWRIIEDEFNPEFNRVSESLFSIGNGHMGQRANFEEQYSGDMLRGNYFAGVYYPDKTRVGWWKNGYPEYFAKIINAINWIGINVEINNQPLDLAILKIHSFRRELDMKEGLLNRVFIAEMEDGNRVEVSSTRFVSYARPELGMIRYSIKPLDSKVEIKVIPYMDGDVFNEDSNYEEKFWKGISQEASDNTGYITLETKKTAFRVCSGMLVKAYIDTKDITPDFIASHADKYVESSLIRSVKPGSELLLEKYAYHTSSLNYKTEDLLIKTKQGLGNASDAGYFELEKEHKEAWAEKWKTSDIQITGDIAAQQGIRYSIFQLHQSYSGEDERFNIGPKGFTGEKYGGVTYWDTEAYCLPFYLGTAPQRVVKNLLFFRYRTLPQAIENARKLGFANGAALYPMVTINGEECHNEWEITFEEIHRNGAIAYAIYNYITVTGDWMYLAPYGFEVLLAISRFWSQRVNWSEQKQKYVILGVTGPNEYENNVNNNFHTNYMAAWTLKFTLKVIEYLKKEHAFIYEEMLSRHHFNELKETKRWKEIIKKMHYPVDEERGIFVQQDGFFDKEINPADNIPEKERPINQHWSWDRILRSPYIKQADTLQTMFWFENDFTMDQLHRNFYFYEPLTVHESSLSSCVHTILASKLGDRKKAHEMFIRSSRLDLNDFNNDTHEGLHVTSMGGTWMAFVMGFAGYRVQNNTLILNPFLPSNWESYSFKLLFRGALLEISVGQNKYLICNLSDSTIPVKIWEKSFSLKPGEKLKGEVPAIKKIEHSAHK